MVGKGVALPEPKKLGIVVVTPFKLLTGFLPAAAGCESYSSLKPSSGVLIEARITFCIAANRKRRTPARRDPNPTHASVIKALRGVKSDNANGLLPITLKLLHRLRPRLEELRLDGQGQQDWLYAGLVAALLWHRTSPAHRPRTLLRRFVGPWCREECPAHGASSPSSLGPRSQACSFPGSGLGVASVVRIGAAE